MEAPSNLDVIGRQADTLASRPGETESAEEFPVEQTKATLPPIIERLQALLKHGAKCRFDREPLKKLGVNYQSIRNGSICETHPKRRKQKRFSDICEND